MVTNAPPEIPTSPKQSGAKNSSPEPLTRLGIIWVSLTIFVVLLIGLLIFIAQNSMTVRIHYLGAAGSINFGVALLLAAAIGALLTVLTGSLRIIQLKLKARKDHHD